MSNRNAGALSIERTHLTGGVDDASGEPARAKIDGTSQSLRVNLWTWDAVELAWVRQTFMDIAALTTAIESLQASIDALTAAIEAM